MTCIRLNLKQDSSGKVMAVRPEMARTLSSVEAKMACLPYPGPSFCKATTKTWHCGFSLCYPHCTNCWMIVGGRIWDTQSKRKSYFSQILELALTICLQYVPPKACSNFLRWTRHKRTFEVQLKDRVAPSGRTTETAAPNWLEFGFAAQTWQINFQQRQAVCNRWELE